MKQCSKCLGLQPESAFPKNKRGKNGLRRWCKTCVGKYQICWREKNRGRRQEYAAKYYRLNREKYLGQHKKNSEVNNLKAQINRQKIKQEAFLHYGTKCVWCNESDIVVLTIDHINNNGGEHRRRLKGRKIYDWLKDNGYPDGFQVLCRNCNWKKHIKNSKSVAV